MLLSSLMLIMWQLKGGVYKTPLSKSLEATYQGSDIRKYAEIAKDKAKDKYPAPVIILPVVYIIAIKKEITLSSTKLSPLPDSKLNMQYNEKTNSGSIGITWNY